MVKIRLSRTGKRNQPHYRIVAIDSSKKRDGAYIEQIGYYNPRTKPPTLKYDKKVLEKWIEHGAQFTDVTHDMFVKEGIIKQTPKRKARIDAMIKASQDRKKGEESGEEEKPAPEKAEKPEAEEKPTAEKTEEKPKQEEKPEKKEEKPEAKKEEKKESDSDKDASKDKKDDKKEK